MTPDRDTGQQGGADGAPNPISVRPELQLGRGDDQSDLAHRAQPRGTG